MMKRKQKRQSYLFYFSIALLAFSLYRCSPAPDGPKLEISQGDHIVLIGNNLCSRMLNFGDFETEVYLRYPNEKLIIRNMCDGGNTPGFRQHAGRYSPWAFPGAEQFQTELKQNSNSQGHFESPDEWLTRLEADIILAFFGYNESFNGPEGLDNFKAELKAFIQHTLSKQYNGATPAQLALVSPIAFEDLSADYDLPNGEKENENLALYTAAMREVAQEQNVLFVDAFSPSKKWFAGVSNLTIDGNQLNEEGYDKFSKFIADELLASSSEAEQHRQVVQEAVMEKNWLWHNDFKIPNGVHVFGRRYNPFGPDNYPAEFRKIREMTAIRDSAIWLATAGTQLDLAAEDAKTYTLPAVESNFQPGDYGRGTGEYLYGDDALETMTVAPGYKIELFASEREFPDLANPVQLSFDNQGRLWVAVMPTYPHWKPGDPKPDDKLLILEDTNNDGKADKQTVFADGLHLPVGFEFAPEGVYVSQGTNLKLFTDTDGDDKADKVEIIFSGFDDHDTHHNISAFCADPSGAIYMAEGLFLHTSVETPYGPVRATNGGFYRFNPQRKQLERTAQLSIPNPWGIAFDEWGQNFFAETSGPAMRWMMPGSVKPRYGISTHKGFDLIEEAHKVRPTSGLEFVSSRHFPEDVQGDILINNNIGFLGTKQHQLVDDTTGYICKFRQDLVQSSDMNFRPVDMEFAPDGSLYIVDWHNVLVGHMQHNARDPYRDHMHGRIYRITYPSRPLVEPAKIVDASIDELLDNLKLPEYRTRYRTRRELRGRNASDVLSKLETWMLNLDKTDARYEHHLLEALWVTWGLNNINQGLLEQLLEAKDFRARTAATRVLRYAGHQIDNQAELLVKAAGDEHGRVRMEAFVAASWLDKEAGLKVVEEAKKHTADQWMIHALETAEAHLKGESVKKEEPSFIKTKLQGKDAERFYAGMKIYEREGHCGTCHQSHGKGLPSSGYPPISGTKWANGDEERLIKLTLKGLHGPMEIQGKAYPGQVPMTQFEGLLDDEEVAAVLTYVRNAFGNKATPVSPEKVKEVRAAIKEKKGFYAPEELLNEHPLEAKLQ